jgi:hypothetical protein
MVNWKRIKQLAQQLFVFIALGFVFLFLKKNWPEIVKAQLKPDFFYLSLAGIASLLSVFFAALAIRYTLLLDNIRISLAKLLRIVGQTNMYRYIPGGVWNHAGLGVSIRDNSTLSIKSASKLVVLNVFLNVYVALFFLVFLLPLPYSLLFLVMYLVSFLVLNVLFQLVNKLWAFVSPKQQMTLPKLSFKTLLNIFLANVGFWIATGLTFAFFVRGISLLPSLSALKYLYLVAAYNIAWACGFLFLPAPGGLGVREFVLGFFLSKVNLALAVGVSVSVLHRLLLVIRDVLVYVVLLLTKKD